MVIRFPSARLFELITVAFDGWKQHKNLFNSEVSTRAVSGRAFTAGLRCNNGRGLDEKTDTSGGLAGRYMVALGG